MIYEHKHTNLTMSLLDSKRRQGDWYAHYYFDMYWYNSTVFSNFYCSMSGNFLQFDNRMDSVHCSKNHHRHTSICRSKLPACSRCLSPLFSRFSLGHQQTLANTDSDACQNLLSHSNHSPCSGRYAVPPQWKKKSTEQATGEMPSVRPGKTSPTHGDWIW